MKRSPRLIVIFGSSGDLATTRLLPAIEGQLKAGRPEGFRVIGVDRKPPRKGAPSWLTVVPGDLKVQETYARLKDAMGAAPDQGALFYLATPPGLFPEVARRLREAGLAGRRSRIAVEKPFGVDLRSSKLLEARLGSAFQRRIFRVDHFLCKDGAAGLARFRFAYGRFEDVWNGRFVDSVQIVADEGAAVAGRGEFYDSVGVVRDMVQNHLLQLLCLVAMDPPESPSRGGAKAKVLESIPRPSRDDVALGQYRGYEREAGVRKGSTTPTFVALKLQVRNRRWDGVPFYLRSGRPLARDATEVVVKFREPQVERRAPRLVRFRIDPEPGIIVTRGRPGEPRKDRPRRGGRGGEYQRVIRGALRGDQRRFVEPGFNELSWSLLDPIIKGQKIPEKYSPGGWGPASSDLLLARDGRSWLDGREGGATRDGP